jgi:transcriptional regulator with XRE-family HTH domain
MSPRTDEVGKKDVRALLSANLKFQRKRKGWSQADLAEQAGISVTFLSTIERGVKWPYPETLASLAEALKIDICALFAEVDQPEFVTDTLPVAKLLDDIAFSIDKAVSQAVHQSLERIKRRYVPASESISQVQDPA